MRELSRYLTLIDDHGLTKLLHSARQAAAKQIGDREMVTFETFRSSIQEERIDDEYVLRLWRALKENCPKQSGKDELSASYLLTQEDILSGVDGLSWARFQAWQTEFAIRTKKYYG